jgi:hypothetical protein
VLTGDEAYAMVVRSAGASLFRDAIDKRVIDALTRRVGSPIDTQNVFRDSRGTQPGIDDLPTQRRPNDFDSDGDGMPDDFERSHQLDPREPADGNGHDLSDEGYTNLEIYLASLTNR